MNADEAIEPIYPKVRRSPDAVPICSVETCMYSAVWLPLEAAPIMTPKIQVMRMIHTTGERIVRKSTPMDATMEDPAATIGGPRTKLRLEIGPTTKADTILIGKINNPASSADALRTAPIHSVIP